MLSARSPNRHKISDCNAEIDISSFSRLHVSRSRSDLKIKSQKLIFEYTAIYIINKIIIVLYLIFRIIFTHHATNPQKLIIILSALWPICAIFPIFPSVAIMVFGRIGIFSQFPIDAQVLHGVRCQEQRIT